MTMTMTEPWWDNPDRPCKGDARYVNVPSGRNSHTQIRQLIAACDACPVVSQCLADAMLPREKRAQTTGVIQGGVWWR